MQLKAADGKEAVLVLEYSFLLPPEKANMESTFAVPLAVPEQVTRGVTHVRVWSDPGTLPEPAKLDTLPLFGASTVGLIGSLGGQGLILGAAALIPERSPADSGWTRLNIEKVRTKDKSLPVLVLQAQRVDLPLTLRLAEVKGERVTVLADRALIRVEVTEGQGHRYRASFFLTQLLTRQLDVELPAPVPSLGLVVTLDGQQVTPEVVDEEGQHSDSGKVAQLAAQPRTRTPFRAGDHVPSSSQPGH